MLKVNIAATKYFLALIALINYMGLGLVITIFPNLILSNQEKLFTSHWALTNLYTLLGLFLAIYPLGQFIGSGILGQISDHYGRKKILSITLIGNTCGFLLSAYAIYILSPTLLFISRAISGFFAGNISVIQASMSDISNPRTKTKNLAMIQISLGLAWVMGPPIGGWLTNLSMGQLSGFIFPFFFIGVLLLILAIMNIIFFKETNTQIKSLQHPNKINFIDTKHLITVFIEKKYRNYFYIWVIFVAGWWLFEAFLPAFLQQFLSLSMLQIGNFLAIMGIGYVLVEYVLVIPISKNISPENMVRYSIIFIGLSILSMPFTHSFVLFCIEMSIFIIAIGFALPGLNSSISNLAPPSEQGKIMGSISSTQALSTVIILIIGGYLGHFSYITNVVVSSVLFLASGLMFILINKKKNGIALAKDF